MEKVALFIIRIIALVFAIRVSISAIIDISLFLAIIAVILFAIYFQLPKFIKA